MQGDTNVKMLSLSQVHFASVPSPPQLCNRLWDVKDKQFISDLHLINKSKTQLKM